jgi:hypothetical protein
MMMATVGVIMWILFLVWLVSALYPSSELCRDSSGNYAYYSLWVCILGGVLLLQYRLMAHSNHAMLAVTSDVIGASLGAVRLWAKRRLRPDRHKQGLSRITR